MSELLTVAQVAKILNVSEKTVMRRFSKETGVIDMSTPQKSKRRYRVLRIPKSVVEKFALKRGARISVPDAPAPKKKNRLPTEDELLRDLVKVAGQHGDAARKTLDKIARRAWAMSFVPEEDWGRMIFFDDGDDYEERMQGEADYYDKNS